LNDALALERCIADGGIAVFPADTVYGLACDPGDRFAVQRLYLLKRRGLDKPSAIMFFDLKVAFAALPELGVNTREGMTRLLPGGVTVLVSNPAGRFPLACGDDVSTLGVRVPDVPRSPACVARCCSRARTAPVERIRDACRKSRVCCVRRSIW
jgi:L-threonylcarbamoyladenylate synthase